MNKYLVYKVSGGLVHMLDQISRSVHLAEQTERRLVIDTWGNPFKNDFNKYFKIEGIDYSTNYNAMREDASLDFARYRSQIEGEAKCIKQHKYLLGESRVDWFGDQVIHSTDQVIFVSWIYSPVGSIWNRFLRFATLEYRFQKWPFRVRKEIITKIEKYEDIENPYLGLHYRNTDMKHDMAEVLAHAQKYLKKAKTLFLSTDDSKARDKLAALLPPDIKIVQFTFPVKTNGLGVHYQNKNNDEVVFNALVDLYYLSRATYFVPSKHSGFSHLVTAIRKGLKFF